jgi:hypothetical protein
MNESYEHVLKTVQEKGKAFDKYLKDLSHVNEELLAKSSILVKSFDEMKGKKHTCPICYTRKQTHTFQPCGHCTCQSCSERALSRNRCFTCRAPVEGIMRIYI